MQTANWWVVAAALGTLAACGSKEPGGSAAASAGEATGATSSTTATSDKNYNTTASAREVAEQSRGDVDCPAKNKSAPRAAGGLVDDVLGVRPGMLYDEAVNFVLCTNELMVAQPVTDRGVNVQTYGQKIRQGFAARLAEARVEKSSKQIMAEMQDEMFARGSNRVTQDLKAGQSKWFVGTIGPPGQERVISAAREEWFEAGRNPTQASVAQALVAKYGAPSRNQNNGGRLYLSWAYDLSGRPVPESSQMINQCIGVADPNSGANYSPDCGLVVAAVIAPLPDNPDISQFMQVGVVHQAAGYQAITDTEKVLARADAQRKAQQVQEAAKNADAPKL